MQRENTCPQCGKEGTVEARLLLPVTIDDGTASMRGVAFEGEALSMMGEKKEHVLNALDDETQRKALHATLRGRRVHVRGKTKVGMDNTSIEMIIQRAEAIPFPQA